MPAAWRSSTQEWEGAHLRQAAKECLARFLATTLAGEGITGLELGFGPFGQAADLAGRCSWPGSFLQLERRTALGRYRQVWEWSGIGCGHPGGIRRALSAPAGLPGSGVADSDYSGSGGPADEAAALLWSVKEAVVKANGCGFHFFSPREVKVQYTAPGENGYLWRGCLENPDQAGNHPGGWEPCSAVSVRLQEVWLAVAWCDKRSHTCQPIGYSHACFGNRGQRLHRQ